MSTPTDLVRGWFRKAESDLQTARTLVASGGPYDTACFHAQQAAEKYLKGFLTFAGQPFPFTHNLEELELRCAGLSPTPDFRGIDVTLLTPYAVQLRYDPLFWPDETETRQALALAEQVRHAVLAVLPSTVYP
jgi:HEPN domain-containing protein